MASRHVLIEWSHIDFIVHIAFDIDCISLGSNHRCAYSYGAGPKAEHGGCSDQAEDPAGRFTSSVGTGGRGFGYE